MQVNVGQRVYTRFLEDDCTTGRADFGSTSMCAGVK